MDRSNCPLQFEHTVPLVDETAPPPKRKLYPLDQRELEELKKQLRDFLDSGRIEMANGAPMVHQSSLLKRRMVAYACV